MSCVHCGRDIDADFRYCPWCGVIQRRKLVDFFLGHPTLDPGRTLRVSRYVATRDQEPHVRFSIWDEHGEARGVVSLTVPEAERLAVFLGVGRSAARLRDAVERFVVRSRVD
jgi:hypothetical protein